MKDVSRRDFMKYCVGSAAVLGLNLSVLGKLEKALAAGGGPPIIWLNGANCTGCTVSLANLFSNSKGTTNVADLLLNTIDLAFHPNLMGAAGDLAVAELRSASTREGGFVLAVDGGIPTAFGGRTCMLWTEDDREITAVEAIQDLAPKAVAVLSIGTCASFGGVPAGNPNPTGIESVGQIAGVDTINIPGCPSHPDWVVGTIAQLLAGESPSLDSDGRPKAFFNKKIHDRCPRKEKDEAKTFGIDGHCLEELGCKGPETKADCYSRYWNSGTNWCIGANAICIGCTENGFPDDFSPFYDGKGRNGDYKEEDKKEEEDKKKDKEKKEKEKKKDKEKKEKEKEKEKEKKDKEKKEDDDDD